MDATGPVIYPISIHKYRSTLKVLLTSVIFQPPSRAHVYKEEHPHDTV